MQTAEKLIQIVNDVKVEYLRRYGITSEWDLDTQDIFLLNCDAEVLNYLQNEDIEAHNDAFKLGISFGLFVIQKEIKRMYYDAYGETMDYIQKEDMYEKTQECVYNYIINGVSDVY